MMTFVLVLLAFIFVWMAWHEVKMHQLTALKVRAEEALAEAEALLKRFHIHVTVPPAALPPKKAKK